MKLRKAAKGRPCMVRIPNVCTHDESTVVLAHFRMSGVSGIGMKANDLLGAWACYSCHAEIDGQTRKSGMSRDELRLAHLEGMVRTIAVLCAEGLV